jgi:hypothetical protein
MNKKIKPTTSSRFEDLTLHFRLIMRLMGDVRVNPLLKLLPAFSLLYLFLFPDLAPGPFDDALVIWLATTFFVELCPPPIVAEHTEALKNVIHGNWFDPDEDVIEVEAEELD